MSYCKKYHKVITEGEYNSCKKCHTDIEKSKLPLHVIVLCETARWIRENYKSYTFYKDYSPIHHKLQIQDERELKLKRILNEK